MKIHSLFLFFLILPITLQAAKKSNADIPEHLCNILLGKSDDISGFDRQNYRFVFPDGGEFFINLGWYIPSLGNSPLSYVETFDSNERFAPKDASPTMKVKMPITEISPDRMAVTLTTFDKDPFIVKFDLNAPLQGRELSVKSISVTAEGETKVLDLKFLTSEYTKKFVEFKGKEAKEIIDILPWAELKKAEETKFENGSPEKKAWHTQIEISGKSTSFDYRAMKIMIKRNSKTVFVPGLSAAGLAHLLNGLKGLGLRPDHPIFKI